MKFAKKDLQEMVYEESERFIKAEEDVVDTDRWSIHYKVIFKDEDTGKYYKSYFSKGATEYQDESPYEYDDDEIECCEVEQKEVLIKTWVEVK